MKDVSGLTTSRAKSLLRGQHIKTHRYTTSMELPLFPMSPTRSIPANFGLSYNSTTVLPDISPKKKWVTSTITKGIKSDPPVKFYDKFARMYANLQYSVLTINHSKAVPSIDKELELENDMKKLCASTSRNMDSIDKACVMLHKLGRIRLKKKYGVVKDEYGGCSIQLQDESGSEAEHIQNQHIDKLRKFVLQNSPGGGKVLPAINDDVSLAPHFTHHIGEGRNLYVDYPLESCNLIQGHSKRNVKERKSGNVGYIDSYKELISIEKIKRFGFWQADLVRGDQPKHFQGGLLGNGVDVFFYCIEPTGTCSVFQINTQGTMECTQVELKGEEKMCHYEGEVVCYGGDGKIVACFGILPPHTAKGVPEFQVRIIELKSVEYTAYPKTPQSPTSRLYHAACLVNNTLWIYGGVTGQKALKYLNDIWTFSLDTKIWQRVDFGYKEKGGFKPEPLANHTMTPVFSKKVLSKDGSIIESFLPAKYEKLNVLIQ